MTFDSDKVENKIKKIDEKIQSLQIKISDLGLIRSKLSKIIDVEINETNPDGSLIYESTGMPRKIKVKPKDELTETDIDDSRREEIFTNLNTKADNQLG
jgi:hypothetical protein